MALTAAALEAQLSSIQTAIAAAIASPAPNWSVGDVSFDQNDYLKMLYEQQSEVIKQLRSIPSEVIASAQNLVGPLGHEATEYLDEEYL